MPPSEAQKRALEKHRAKVVDAGGARVTLLLSGPAVAAIGQLAKVHGSKVRAVEAAVLAAKVDADYRSDVARQEANYEAGKNALVLTDAKSGRVEPFMQVAGDQLHAAPGKGDIEPKPADASRKPSATKTPPKAKKAAGDAPGGGKPAPKRDTFRAMEERQFGPQRRRPGDLLKKPKGVK